MPNDIIQVDYDQLDAIAKRFGAQAAANQQLMERVGQSMQPLQGGGWQGRGSAAFFAEMNREVLPAMQRFADALDQARTVTLKVRDVMQAAEEEASAPFRSTGSATDDRASDAVTTSTAVAGGWMTAAALSAKTSDDGGILEWVHGGLDVVGFIPGIGELADGANALIYLAEGRHLEAGISAAAMIPLFGDAGKVGKWGIKGGRELLEEGAERVARDALQEGVERAGREGLETLSERAARDLPGLVAKYGDEGQQIIRRFGPDVGGDILHTYDTIADVPGADRLMRDVLAGESTTQGALSEIGYAASLRRRGVELEGVGDVINGQKAGDILVKNGQVIDVKDYNWSSPYYQNPRNWDKVGQGMIDQVRLHRQRYPGRPIEYAFTDLDQVPASILRSLIDEGVNVTQVTWIGR